MIRCLYHRLLALLGLSSLTLDHPKMPPARELPRHEGRRDRKEQRAVWDWSKYMWYSTHHKAPMLRGARLARTQEACSPRHLTALSKGAKVTWGELPS